MLIVVVRGVGGKALHHLERTGRRRVGDDALTQGDRARVALDELRHQRDHRVLHGLHAAAWQLLAKRILHVGSKRPRNRAQGQVWGVRPDIASGARMMATDRGVMPSLSVQCNDFHKVER